MIGRLRLIGMEPILHDFGYCLVSFVKHEFSRSIPLPCMFSEPVKNRSRDREGVNSDPWDHRAVVSGWQ